MRKRRISENIFDRLDEVYIHLGIRTGEHERRRGEIRHGPAQVDEERSLSAYFANLRMT